MRLWFLALTVLFVVDAVNRRGWLVGIATAAVYGGIFVSASLPTPTERQPKRSDPLASAVFVGVLAFLGLAIETHLHLLVCAAGGAVGAVVGAVSARRRSATRAG